jgi:hypothetical protein
MNTTLDIAAVLSAILWPLLILLVVIRFKEPISELLKAAGRGFRVKAGNVEVSIEPTKGIRPPGDGSENDKKPDNIVLPSQPKSDALPPDYFFINHTSFLREKMQEEFKRITHVDLPHYDIRVIIDSYYIGALQRIHHVEYFLHEAFPEPIQFRKNYEDKFLLKELANGEFVLLAKIFMIDRQEPVLLQRYITLWESGPKID